MEEKKYDIFISYRRDEGRNVRLLKYELEKSKKYTIFFDESEIRSGVQYEKKITDAMKNSKCLLIMMSKYTCKYFKERKENKDFDWVEKEINDASKLQIDIIPVRLYLEEEINDIKKMYENLENCAPKNIFHIISPLQYSDVHLDTRFIEGDAKRLIEDIDITLKAKESFNWKALITSMVILFLLVFGYLGYINYNNDTHGVNSQTYDNFGTSLKPDGLQAIYCAKKDKDLNWSGWKGDKLIINKDDKSIYVEIHYNAYGAALKNIRLGLSEFPLNIDTDEKINISSFVVADNAQPIIGNMYIHSLSDIELIPERISFQEDKCKSASCETKLPNYSSQGEKIRDIFKKGIKVGDKSKGHYGNLVIKFRISHKEKMVENITNIEKNKEDNSLISLTPNQNTDVPTLSVSNKGLSSKRWYESVQIDSAELLSFDLHYFTSSLPINNLKAHIDTLDGKVFNAGDTLTVKGRLTADNLDTASGEVEVTFDEKVKLKLYSVSWQKWPCRAVSCESPINKNINNLFKNTGLSLGNISGKDDEYSGNLIIAYKVTKVEATASLLKTIPHKASLASPDSVSPLEIAKKRDKKYTDWKLNQDLKVGDIIALQLHVYANNAPIQNLKMKLGNLTKSIFEADSSVQVSSIVSATGVLPLKGSIGMNFSEKVKLVYWKYKWATKKADDTSKEITKVLPNNQNGYNVFNKGVSLGSLPQGYRGNLILYFWLKEV